MVTIQRVTTHCWFAALALSSLLSACDEGATSAQTRPQPDTAGVTDASAASPDADAPAVPVDPLSDEDWLIRASLDLRGFRPSTAERAAFAAAPNREQWVDNWLTSEDFANRVGEWTALQFRTRIDSYPIGPGAFGLEEESGWHRALADEVPSLAEWVALNDLPWSTLLRAQHTFVDPVLVDVWPVEPVQVDGRIPDGTTAVRYTDGRPLAGVLSSTALWWRHSSTVENANRGRANALSTALLCDNYLSQPIDFPSDIDIGDSEAIADAIQTNSACVSCHATLDPIASHLWGFMRGNGGDLDAVYYTPELEREWLRRDLRAPAWFDEPSSTLNTLAEHMIRDPRFVSCAVERTWTQLMRREPGEADRADLAVHRESFIASGLSIRTLVRSIVLGAAYEDRQGTSEFGALASPRGSSIASAEQLAITFEHLAGVRFLEVGRPLESLDRGVRSLVGASDRAVSAEPSVGLVLFQRRLAEVAAERLVTSPNPETELGALLSAMNLQNAPTDADIVTLLNGAHARTYTESDAAVDALASLWSDARGAVSSSSEAWAIMLTGILADPLMLYY
jgi:hypothetical protein